MFRKSCPNSTAPWPSWKSRWGECWILPRQTQGKARQSRSDCRERPARFRRCCALSAYRGMRILLSDGQRGQGYGLEIAWFQARVFGNPAEHSWTDLLAVVKGKDIVRPPRAGQQTMRASGFALDSPTCSQQCDKYGFGLRGWPITHAGTAKRQSKPETGLSFSI